MIGLYRGYCTRSLWALVQLYQPKIQGQASYRVLPTLACRVRLAPWLQRFPTPSPLYSPPHVFLILRLRAHTISPTPFRPHHIISGRIDKHQEAYCPAQAVGHPYTRVQIDSPRLHRQFVSCFSAATALCGAQICTLIGSHELQQDEIGMVLALSHESLIRHPNSVLLKRILLHILHVALTTRA